MVKQPQISNNLIYHINKMKDKNHMIISINAAFDKIQHPFMIIFFSNMSIEGKYVNIMSIAQGHN